MKISIIMPVFNTNQEYLKSAVASVLEQTYKDFELIIVDDGSNSDCANLCDWIARQDTRISVIHQTNSGVSMARNHGTEVSTGDYIMYMDSDDILAPYALEEGIGVIKKTQAQFVFAGIQHIKAYSDAVFHSTVGDPEYYEFAESQIEIIMQSFLTQRNALFANVRNIGAVNRGPCARLIDAQIAKLVRFESGLIIGEDVTWNLDILKLCKKVCFVNSIWYGYLVYNTSSLRRYYGNRAELLEKYHNILYARNRMLCEKHPVAYATNMAVSFYSMVNYEYLSDKCLLSKRDKKRELKQILNREPWTKMMEKDVRSRLPMRYRVFLFACIIGMEFELLQFWEAVKRWKGKNS